MNLQDSLKTELNRRIELNPRYSLRAFARDIDMSASALSNFINGRYKLSLGRAKVIAGYIGLPTEDIENLDAKSSALRRKAELSLDAFSCIADWQYFAILETVSLKNVKTWRDAQKIIGIDLSDLKECVKKLIKTKCLRANGKKFCDLEVVNEQDTLDKGISSEAVRHHHKQLLKKAILATDSQDMSERSLQSLTIALSEDQAQEAMQMVEDFRKKIHRKFQNNTPEKDRVYGITLCCFNVNTNKRD